MEQVIDSPEKRFKRMKELGMINRKPSNLIKMQSKYNEDLDYIPGYDDGEEPKHYNE